MSNSQIKISALTKNALSLFSKNGGKILALFTLFALINLLFVAGLNYINSLETGASYKAIKSLTYNIFTLYINYILYFVFIKTNNSNIGLHKSFAYIIKKTIPLIITSAIGLAIFASIGGVIYSALILANHLQDFVKIIAYIAIAIITFFFLLFGIRFFVFSTFIAVLEEKYYFLAMMQSFEYSRDKVWPIFYKNLIITLIIFLPFVIIDASFLKNSTIDASNIETIRAVLFYLPQQFLVVINYLLYKFYKNS